MRSFQKADAAAWAPIAPDAVHTFVSTALSTSYAADWPGTSSSTNPLPRFVELRSNVAGWVSWSNANVAIPSSNVLTSGASGYGMFLPNVPLERMLPAGSTGYSLAFSSSGYASMVMWGP